MKVCFFEMNCQKGLSSFKAKFISFLQFFDATEFGEIKTTNTAQAITAFAISSGHSLLAQFLIIPNLIIVFIKFCNFGNIMEESLCITHKNNGSGPLYVQMEEPNHAVLHDLGYLPVMQVLNLLITFRRIPQSKQSLRLKFYFHRTVAWSLQIQLVLFFLGLEEQNISRIYLTSSLWKK